MSWPFGETRAGGVEAWPDWQDVSPRRQRVQSRAEYLAPVFAAIRHIVDYGATMPLKAYRTTGNEDERQRVAMPGLISDLNQPGGPGQIAWLGQVFHAIATCGNAVGWINDANGYGYPSSVRWLGYDAWSWNEADRRWYVYGTPVPNDRIVHIPWIVPEGKKLGLSPIEHFATLIGAGLSAQEYANIGRGGGAPPAILTNIRRTLRRKEAQAARVSLEASLMAGRPWVTGADWKLDMVTIPPNHLQFLETLKLTATQTAAIWGLDPREVGGAAAESMTYVNDESRAIHRAANMRPYLERVEKHLSRLVPNKVLLEFDIPSTIRSDTQTQTTILTAQVQARLRSRNEARIVLGLPPVPGGDAFEPTTPARATQPPNPSQETP